MLARGFWREMLAELVLAGFAMAVSETIRTGGPTIRSNGTASRPRAGGRARRLTWYAAGHRSITSTAVVIPSQFCNLPDRKQAGRPEGRPLIAEAATVNPIRHKPQVGIIRALIFC